MSKNRKKRKQKPCNIQTPDENNYVCISKDELKELIISAVKEEKAQEDDASPSNTSFAMKLCAIALYCIFCFASVKNIIAICATGITSADMVFELVLNCVFGISFMVLGFRVFIGKSKSEISQHFTVLTTLVALIIAIMSR